MTKYDSQELMDKNQKLQDELDRPEKFHGEHNIIRMAIAKNRRRFNIVLDKMVEDVKRDKKKKESKGLSAEQKKQKKKDYEERKKQAV